MATALAKTALERPVTHQVGGHIALDFANTAGEHLARTPDEMLVDWEVFVRWSAQVGLIAAEAYQELLRHPEAMEKVIELREAIHRVGLAIARKERVPQRYLDVIREQAGGSRPAVVSGRERLRWRPDAARASGELRALLAGEALSLFCSPRAMRIGVCEGGLCGWLFLDDSRGKRRRWCDMKDCGNRAKARRYYEQKKGLPGS